MAEPPRAVRSALPHRARWRAGLVFALPDRAQPLGRTLLAVAAASTAIVVLGGYLWSGLRGPFGLVPRLALAFFASTGTALAICAIARWRPVTTALVLLFAFRSAWEVKIGDGEISFSVPDLRRGGGGGRRRSRAAGAPPHPSRHLRFSACRSLKRLDEAALEFFKACPLHLV